VEGASLMARARAAAGREAPGDEGETGEQLQHTKHVWRVVVVYGVSWLLLSEVCSWCRKNGSEGCATLFPDSLADSPAP
jgi:hypothetical protein